jgi:hypothetical protein
MNQKDPRVGLILINLEPSEKVIASDAEKVYLTI